MHFKRICRGFWLPVVGLMLIIPACRRSPQADEARSMGRGAKELQQKNYAAAIVHFKNAVQAMPKDAEPYYQLGLAYLATNDVRAAFAYFRKASELNPKHTGAQLKMAELMSRSSSKEDVAGAEKRARDVLSLLPDDAAALNLLAITELRLGKPESAEAHLEQALRKSPSHLQASVTLAKSRLARKDVKGAEEALQQAVKTAPKSPDPLVTLGEFYLALRKPAEAEQTFRHALEIDPKSGPALLNLGGLQARSGQLEQASNTYRQLALLPENRYKTAYGLFLFQSGKQKEAVAEFEKLTRENPPDRGFRTLLVRTYLTLNRVSDAEKVLSAALAKNPSEVDSLLLRSRIYLNSGKYAEAQKDLNQVLHFRKDSAEAHYLMAKLHQARGQNGNRQQELGEALRLEPGFMAARIEQAQTLIANRGAQQALKLLDEAPANQKAAVPIVVQRNWALLALGQAAEARKGIDQALKAGKVPEAMLQDAALKLTQKDYAGARAAAEGVLQQQPEETRALSVLVQSYAAEKQLPAGLQKAREYAARQPKSAAVQQFLGQLLSANGDNAGARRAFEAAKAANPALVGADLALANLDIGEGKRDEARKRLSAVLSAHNDNIAAHYMTAKVEFMDGKTAAAIEQYRKVLALDEKNVAALNDLAYLLTESKQLDEALKYAQQAKELVPENSAVDDTIGWAYYQKGMYSLAVAHLQSAVAKEGTPRRRYHLAMAYLKAGDAKRGQQTFEAALKIDPRLPEAQAARLLFENRTK
jgi:tetratricopeptide (TPR) repeat protein